MAVPMYSCITLTMQISDAPYIDNTIGITRRSTESKAILMSTKMMVSMRFDTRPMSCVHYVFNCRPSSTYNTLDSEWLKMSHMPT